MIVIVKVSILVLDVCKFGFLKDYDIVVMNKNYVIEEVKCIVLVLVFDYV